MIDKRSIYMHVHEFGHKMYAVILCLSKWLLVRVRVGLRLGLGKNLIPVGEKLRKT